MFIHRLLFVALVTTGATVADPAPAAACSGEPATGLGVIDVRPTDGVPAAIDTRVWIAADRFGPGPGEPAAVTTFGLLIAGLEVATTARTITVAGEREAALVVLTPSQPLPAGAGVDVVAIRGGLRSIIGHFQVGAAVDPTVPARAIIDRTTIEGSFFGGFSCPEPSRVTFAVEPGDQLLVVLPADADLAQPIDRALAVGVDGQATAVDLAAGDHRLQVVNVDLAGHVGPPSDVVTITVPPEVSGCNAGGRARPSLALALALALGLLARRRRSRTSIEPTRRPRWTSGSALRSPRADR